MKFKLLPEVTNRNTEHEKLEEFKENLQNTIENLSYQKQEIVHYEFANFYLRMTE